LTLLDYFDTIGVQPLLCP